MRWFKHLTASHDDEDLSEILDKFGAEGYGSWWLIVEQIASQMNKTDRCFCRYSFKKWKLISRLSSQKLEKVLSFLSLRKKIHIEKCENYITITIPNLLKYRDEYTNRTTKVSGESIAGIGINSRRDTEAELDTEKKKENTKEKKEQSQAARAVARSLKADACEILDFLNESCDRNYQADDVNLGLIIARLKGGATKQDCRSIIAMKRREWITDEKMCKFLRPGTLFNKTKFSQYIGELCKGD